MPDLNQCSDEATLAPARAQPQSSLNGSTSLDGPTAQILLPQVPRELVAGGFTDKPVDYARVYRAVLSGAIPAEQVTTNRWSILRGDLPVVARVLGLIPVAKTEKPSRARRISASAEHAVA